MDSFGEMKRPWTGRSRPGPVAEDPGVAANVYVGDVVDGQLLEVVGTVGDDNAMIAVVTGDVAGNPPSVLSEHHRLLVAGCRHLSADVLFWRPELHGGIHLHRNHYRIISYIV